MPGFDITAPTKREVSRRFSQRDIFPSAVKNKGLALDVIKNTGPTQEDAVSLGSGAQLNVTSTVALIASDKVILGVCPFMIDFFESSFTAANHIPFGANVDGDIYRIIGPLAVTGQTSLGHDGFNAVFKTALYNNTGLTKDIIVVTQARFISGLGGQAG